MDKFLAIGYSAEDKDYYCGMGSTVDAAVRDLNSCGPFVETSIRVYELPDPPRAPKPQKYTVVKLK